MKKQTVNIANMVARRRYANTIYIGSMISMKHPVVISAEHETKWQILTERQYEWICVRWNRSLETKTL